MHSRHRLDSVGIGDGECRMGGGNGSNVMRVQE
jgi:hypothetical protein